MHLNALIYIVIIAPIRIAASFAIFLYS